MSEPYEPHYKRCGACGEETPPDKWVKEMGLCEYCARQEKGY